MKRASISDVAARAGVSKAAVSKVLRGAYGTSEAMRKRVEDAIADLNYRPSPAARGLRGRTFTLGVLLPDIRSWFFPDLLDGVAEKLEGTEYQTLLGNGHTQASSERELVETMLARKMDGVILISPRLADDHVRRIAQTVPTVFIGRHQSGLGFDTVNNDDVQGGRLAVEHLVTLGHRRIAHLVQESYRKGEHTPPAKRFIGYKAAMKECGLADQIQFHQAGNVTEARNETLKMMQRPNAPSAVLAWTDSIALDAMSAVDEMGLRIPEDVSIIGYDNSSVCAMQRIMLTSIDQSAHLLGEMAAQLLMERIDGRREEVHFVTPPRLVVRRTTGMHAN